MVIMAVDNHHQRLIEFVDCLHECFPDAKIVDFTDPLLAVQYSFNHLVDVVFTDVVMRGMDGETLMKGIHQKNAHAKVVLLTEPSMVSEQDVQEFAQNYLRRPVTKEMLKEIIST